MYIYLLLLNTCLKECFEKLKQYTMQENRERSGKDGIGRYWLLANASLGVKKSVY
uniref:Uncharacterized protein n=1 Tax=Arion vulgaris TaxID=1028688 RepID=A0A0B7AY08_9EUPU